jgi:K+-sensing histidine kinase KdpD
LIENACRFSAAGQPVRVSGREASGRYRIEVVDEGLGMSAAQRESAAAFVQFDRKKLQQQGLGLGIAIARLTAEFAGGKMALEEGPGARGLRAILELPVAMAPAT